MKREENIKIHYELTHEEILELVLEHINKSFDKNLKNGTGLVMSGVSKTCRVTLNGVEDK